MITTITTFKALIQAVHSIFYTLQAGAQAERPNTSLRSGQSSWCATASGGVFEQPLQGCPAWSMHLYGGVLSVGWPWTLSGNSGCPEVLSSQSLSKTSSVQDVHTLLSPHFFSPGPAVFCWLFPHAGPQVLLTQAHTEELFGMLYASAFPQFIQLLKTLRTSKMKWPTLLFEETLLILTPFLEVEHVLRWNL